MSRELSDRAIKYQAEAFVTYEARGGRLALSAWLDSKDFTLEDRAAIIAELCERERGPQPVGD